MKMLIRPRLVGIVLLMPTMIGCAWVWGFESVSDASDGGTCEVCLPAVPQGWQGPLEIFESAGTSLPPLPSCSNDYPNAIFDGVAQSPSSACSCTCDAPTAITCSTPSVHYFSDPTCATSCAPDQNVGTGCTPLSEGSCSGTHFTFDPAVASGGSCAPHSTTPTPVGSAISEARLCGLPTPPGNGTCDATELCAPRAEVPFDLHYCILHAGTSACPSQYPVQEIYGDDASDAGGCAPCTCDAPSGATCDSEAVDFSNGPNCNATSLSSTIPQSCTALGGAKSALSKNLTPTGGSCAAHGGETRNGSAAAAATTVCCTP